MLIMWFVLVPLRVWYLASPLPPSKNSVLVSLYSTVVLYHVQGFLQAELVAEARKGLNKRCLACSEFLMQNMESLDAIVSVHDCIPIHSL